VYHLWMVMGEGLAEGEQGLALWCTNWARYQVDLSWCHCVNHVQVEWWWQISDPVGCSFQ